MNSITLKNLQHQMLGWLQHGNDEIADQIVETENVTVAVRLDIYANAYRLRLLEALQDTFPALHTLMGDEDFEQLAFAYIDKYPSAHFSLRYFGHQLASFLTTREPWIFQPLLSEMASFEWLLRDAFDARTVPPMTLAQLQQIKPEQWPELVFSFHPSTRRIDLVNNIPQLWQAIDHNEPPIAVKKCEHPVAWLIWRQELRTLYRSLEVDEAWAIDCLLKGGTFTDVCEGISEWVDAAQAPVRVAGFIQLWISEGLLITAASK